MTAWVRVRSWHIEAEFRTGRTLCGLTVRAHPDRQAGEHQLAGWSETLPMDAKSCESCLRLLAAAWSETLPGGRSAGQE